MIRGWEGWGIVYRFTQESIITLVHGVMVMLEAGVDGNNEHQAL